MSIELREFNPLPEVMTIEIFTDLEGKKKASFDAEIMPLSGEMMMKVDNCGDDQVRIFLAIDNGVGVVTGLTLAGVPIEHGKDFKKLKKAPPLISRIMTTLYIKVLEKSRQESESIEKN